MYLDFAAKTQTIWVNNVCLASLVAFATSGATTASVNFLWVDFTGAAGQFYCDDFQYFAQSGYFPSISTMLLLNATYTPTVAGNYAYRWVLWSSGTEYDEQWTPFTVANNVQLVSGASTPTNWTFIPATATSTNNIDYQSNFASGTWGATFAGGQYYIYTSLQAAGNSYYTRSVPTATHGAEHVVGLITTYPPQEEHAYWSQPSHNPAYLTDNSTGLTTYMIFPKNQYLTNTGTIVLSATTAFDESTLCYNNAPAAGTTIASWDSSTDYTANIGWNTNQYVTGQNTTASDTAVYFSKEWPFSAYLDVQPKEYIIVSMFWAQTNTSETVTMNSPTAAYSLPAGALITFTYTTTDSNPRTLELWNGVSNVGSYSLGTNIGSQIYTYTLPASVSFTRWDVTGTFSAGSYLKISSLTVNHYTYAAPPISFLLSPNEHFSSGAIAPGTWNYTIAIPVQQNGGTITYQVQQSVTNYVIATNALTIISYTPLQGTGTVVNFFAPDNTPLSFSQFAVTLNSTLNNITTSHGLYSNTFFADIGSNFTLGIRDRFGNQILTYDSYTATPQFFVNLNNPGVSITIPMFSLKVYNQAGDFCLVNITNTAFPSVVWSQYQAPGESVAYYLAASPYYILTINDTETLATTSYAINLNGPQAFLITSTNTIANAIFSIQNMNTTIGNQITNVNISLSNQNSNINTSIVNVDINLANVNSTLGANLISLGINQTNLANQIGVNFVATNTSIYDIGNWVNTSYNLLSAQTFLVNNSIYTTTSILQAGITNLNNTANASFTTLIVKSDYLTYIFQHSVFSDLLNYSADYNLTSDLYWTSIISNSRNESYVLEMQYAGQVQNLTISAKDATQRLYIPQNATYRIWSVANQTYLNPWTPLSSNSTGNGTAVLDFGYYKDINVPVAQYNGTSLVDVLIFGGISALISLVLVWKRKSPVSPKRAIPASFAPGSNPRASTNRNPGRAPRGC